MPEQQAVIVSFLARVADRRSAARRVKELGEILLKASPSWQRLLMNAEPWSLRRANVKTTKSLRCLEIPEMSQERCLESL